MHELENGWMMGTLGALDRIPANHPLRALRALLEPVLQPRYAADPPADAPRLSSLLSGFALQGTP